MRAEQKKLRVRVARGSDFREIATCYWSAPEVPWDIYSNPRLMEQLMDPEEFLVAEVKGQVVGFIHSRSFRKRPWFDPKVNRYGQILELHIKPRHRAKGIGSALTSQAISGLEEAGCRIIYTHTDETNEPALKLYRRFGFRPFLKTFYLSRKGRRNSSSRSHHAQQGPC